MKPKQESDKAIKAIEKFLSNIGLHGGNVKIEEHIKGQQVVLSHQQSHPLGVLKPGDFFNALVRLAKILTCLTNGNIYTTL